MISRLLDRLAYSFYKRGRLLAMAEMLSEVPPAVAARIDREREAIREEGRRLGEAMGWAKPVPIPIRRALIETPEDADKIVPFPRRGVPDICCCCDRPFSEHAFGTCAPWDLGVGA